MFGFCFPKVEASSRREAQLDVADAGIIRAGVELMEALVEFGPLGSEISKIAGVEGEEASVHGEIGIGFHNVD